MKKKPPTNEELLRKVRKAVEEGRVEFAPEPEDDDFPPEFAEHFAQEILHRAWDDRGWCSEMTEVTDFRWNERAKVLADLQRVYGVDCSDDLNLWVVMRRCLAASTRH